MKAKRLILIVFASLMILLVPLIAMQFTDEVNWTFFDFVIAGILLIGTGLLCELAIRKVKSIKYRLAICVILVLFLVLTWAELAIGIF